MLLKVCAVKDDFVAGFSENELWDVTFGGRPARHQFHMTLQHFGAMSEGNWLSRTCECFLWQALSLSRRAFCQSHICMDIYINQIHTSQLRCVL